MQVIDRMLELFAVLHSFSADSVHGEELQVKNSRKLWSHICGARPRVAGTATTRPEANPRADTDICFCAWTSQQAPFR